MPWWRAGLAAAGALVAVPVLPPAVAAADLGAAVGTRAMTPDAGCGSAPAPVEPITDVPWAQLRYAPERLAPLATGAGVTVAIIDSGVDARHPQLRGRVTRGADYLDPPGDGMTDCAEHGTAVASIIAARPRDGVRFRGLAPGASILPVRVSEQQIVDGKESGRTVTPAQFAQAIRWAVERGGADVLNLSVVLYEDHPAVRSSIAYAIERDVVVVAAVGNLHDNGDPVPYPAAYDGVLGVGAIGSNGARAQFSQVGSYVDVVAPGGQVLTATPGGGHKVRNGTSYAAPFVAATAALVRDYRPDLGAADVVERIVATADPAPSGERGGAYGNGVLNPYRAVTDTRPAAGPPPVEALPPTRPDPALAARRQRRSQTREMSLWLTGIAGGVASVAVMVAIVLPRAARRHWLPGAAAAIVGPSPVAGTADPMDDGPPNHVSSAPTEKGRRSSAQCRGSPRRTRPPRS